MALTNSSSAWTLLLKRSLLTKEMEGATTIKNEFFFFQFIIFPSSNSFLFPLYQKLKLTNIISECLIVVAIHIPYFRNFFYTLFITYFILTQLKNHFGLFLLHVTKVSSFFLASLTVVNYHLRAAKKVN